MADDKFLEGLKKDYSAPTATAKDDFLGGLEKDYSLKKKGTSESESRSPDGTSDYSNIEPDKTVDLDLNNTHDPLKKGSTHAPLDPVALGYDPMDIHGNGQYLWNVNGKHSKSGIVDVIRSGIHKDSFNKDGQFSYKSTRGNDITVTYMAPVKIGQASPQQEQSVSVDSPEKSLLAKPQLPDNFKPVSPSSNVEKPYGGINIVSPKPDVMLMGDDSKKLTAHAASVKGDYDFSNQILNSVSDDKDGYVYELKAHNQLAAGDVKGAKQNLIQAIDLNPNNTRLYSQLALVAAKDGDEKTAIESADRFIKDTGTPNGNEQTASDLANSYAIKGNKERADFYNKTAQQIKEFKAQQGEANTLKTLPDYLIHESFPSKLVAGGAFAMEKGIDTLHDALTGTETTQELIPGGYEQKKKSLTPFERVVTGVMGLWQVGMGAGMYTPAGEGIASIPTSGALAGTAKVAGEFLFPSMMEFNMALTTVGEILPTDIYKWVAQPVSSALQQVGVDPEKLSKLGQMGVQMGDMAGLILASRIAGIVAGKIPMPKEQIPEYLQKAQAAYDKMTNREPLKPDEAKTVFDAIENMTPEDLQESSTMVAAYTNAKETEAKLKDYQDNTPDPTYRVNSEMVKSPDEVIQKVDELKKEGVTPENITVDIRNDEQGQKKVEESIVPVELPEKPIIPEKTAEEVKQEPVTVPEVTDNVEPQKSEINAKETKGETPQEGEALLNENLGEKTAGETTVEPAVKPKTEKTSKNFVDKPIKEINTDEKRFQNRTELDKEQLKQIKDNWNDNELDPVVIWKDKDGKTYLLAGHHRLEAAKQLGKKTIVSRYFKGTEAEAITYAKEKSNANRTMEQPFDRAKIYRKMREDGAKPKEIRTALETEGKNKVYVENLSYLNPTGKVMTMLKSLRDAGDKQTARITEQVADWIGDARKFFPELTDAHETELYDWLVNKHALDKIKTKTEFNQRLTRVADAIRMNPEEPLNLEHKQTFGTLETEKNNQIAKVAGEIKELEKERKDKSTATTEKRLSEIGDEIQKKTQELSRLKQELITAKEGDKAQTDIFSQINESISKGEISDERANTIIRSENSGELKEFEQSVNNQAKVIENKAKSAKSEAEITESVESIDKAIGEIDRKIAGTESPVESGTKPESDIKSVEDKSTGKDVKSEPEVNTDKRNETKVRESKKEKFAEKAKEIEDRRKSILDQLRENRNDPNRTEQLGAGLDKKDEKLLIELAKTYIDSGINEVAKIVDAVHEHIKDFIDISKEELEKIIGKVQEESGKTVGVSHEALKKVAESLGLDEPKRGDVLTPKEYVERGRELIRNGVDPEKVADEFKKDDKVSADAISVVRAHFEDLLREQESIREEHGTNSQQYKDAKAKTNEFEKTVVKPMGTKAGASMRALQGETDLESGSFVELERMYNDQTGKEFTEKQTKKAEELAAKNKELTDQLNKKIQELDDAIKKAAESESKNPKRIKEAATRIAANIRKGKLSRPDVFSAATPASLVWDGALEVAAKTVEAGGTVAQAIADGIAHIKNSDWYKGTDKKDEAEKAFSDFVTDNSKEKKDELFTRFVDKKDNKFDLQDVRDIWNYAKKEYLDKGSDYKQMLSGVSKDLGLTPEQVREALSQPKTKARDITDEMYLLQRRRRQALAASRNWVAEANTPMVMRFIKATPRFFFRLYTYGHGTVGAITHMGTNIFLPSQWKIYFPNFIKQFKFAYGSTAEYEKAMENLTLDPNFVTANRAGLGNDPYKIYDDYQMFGKYADKTSEESGKKGAGKSVVNFFTRLGVAGDRGFNVLKVHRQEVFNLYYDQLSAVDKQNPEVLKKLATMINQSTGTTNTKVPGWTGSVFFATRLEISRWERLVQPVKAAETFLTWNKASNADKAVAKIVAKRTGEYVATYAALMAANAALLSLTGSKQKINVTDPTKSDWMKFKAGDKTIALDGGMTSTIGFVARLMYASLESDKDLKGKSRWDLWKSAMGDYAAGKLSPIAGTAKDVATHKTFEGDVLPFFKDKPSEGHEQLSLWKYIMKRQTPIPLSEGTNDVMRMMKEKGMTQPDINQFMWGAFIFAASGGTGMRIGVAPPNMTDREREILNTLKQRKENTPDKRVETRIKEIESRINKPSEAEMRDVANKFSKEYTPPKLK